MARYIIKRILTMIPVLLLVSVLIFVLVRLTPADPIASMTKGKNISDEAKAELRAHYHLDKTEAEQYFIWIGGVVRGDFGESYTYKQEVSDLIGQRIGTTLSLVLFSTLLALVIAIPFGVFSAVHMNGWPDKLMSTISLVLVASPVFLTALVLMYVFALKLGWAAPYYRGGGLKDMVLPAIALAASMIALTGRITRSGMIEQLNSDYIRTAKAKGLAHRRVVWTYALKNALIPVITVTSVQVGSLLMGAVLVENVFAMGGLGDLLITAIKAADYPVVQGVTLMMVLIFQCINLLVDILYSVLDPRIRMQ